MKVKDLIKLVEEDGWFSLKQKATGHRQFKHSIKKGRVTIAGKLSEDVLPKTRDSVLRQAGLK